MVQGYNWREIHRQKIVAGFLAIVPLYRCTIVPTLQIIFPHLIYFIYEIIYFYDLNDYF